MLSIVSEDDFWSQQPHGLPFYEIANNWPKTPEYIAHYPSSNPKTRECHMFSRGADLERRGVLNSLLNPGSDRFHQAFCRVALADGKRYEDDSLFFWGAK